MEPEKLFLAVRVIVGGGLFFLNRSIYQMYGHDLLNRSFMQIVFFLMFILMMQMLRKFSLFRLVLELLSDLYRIYKNSRNKD